MQVPPMDPEFWRMRLLEKSAAAATEKNARRGNQDDWLRSGSPAHDHGDAAPT